MVEGSDNGCRKQPHSADDYQQHKLSKLSQTVKALRTQLQTQRNHKPNGCCSHHRKGRKKKNRTRSKVLLTGEKFEDPDPYQLAVRKTNYGKRKEKLKFVGEQFQDPDPYGLAIRKTSSTSSCTSDREVSYEYRTQLAETHPATVFAPFDYINREKCIAEMPEEETKADHVDVVKQSEPPPDRKALLAQACAVGVKNVLLLGYGMTLGFPTIVIPAILGGDGREPALEKDVTLSREQISWLSSINLICVPLGSIFSGMLAQPIGRRRAMQLINIPIFIAWMLFHFASDVTFLYLGLALAGISGGLGEAPVLTYVAEITQPCYRGMLAATGSTCVILGVLIEFLMGSFMKWRTVALISSVVPILAATLLFFIPESPVWLASKGRLEQSKAALAWLRGWTTEEQVEAEFKEIEHQMTKDAELQKDFTIVDKARLYTQRAFLQPFGIILLCFFIGHFSGMTTLQTYAVQIFHTLKAPINKYYATCLLGLTELIGTLFCVFLVHRTGKRPLVFISTIGCAVCFFGAASYAYFLSDIPGASVQNVVANVSSIKADITVIPLQTKEVIAEWHRNSSELRSLNLTHIEMQFANGSTLDTLGTHNSSLEGIVYAAQSFTNYYLNDSLNEPINITITYGEYVKSAIPREVFVPLPHVNKNKFVWVPLTLLLGSAFLTHVGIRLIPWILIGELFAPNVRAGGSGLAGGIAYIFGFIANKTFLKMLAVFTLPGTFWIYSLVTILGAIILYKVLPETEGKSLQEIETYFLPRSKRSARVDQEAPAPPQPGPKHSTASIQPAPPPIPPKPYPLKDDIDRARRISLVPRQMSQSSRNTTVSDFSRASFNSQHSHNHSGLSRNSSWTSYTLEDRQDQSHPQVFRKISETLPQAIVTSVQNAAHPVKEPKPPLSRHHSSNVLLGKEPIPNRKISSGKHPILASNDIKIPIHKTQPMTRPVRARAKRPPPSHQFDFQTCESNKKFEEFLHRYQDKSDGDQVPVNTTMRHVTSAHDLKAFEKDHLPGAVPVPPNGGMLTDRKIFNSATKLTSSYARDTENQTERECGFDNPEFHLSSSDESTDM
ncbi:facilitated trehalose transporter Tret1-like isoform X2 [Anopheles funestus]|uniref:facilitated trehalose transporter Tret1-like isoform X2 n=1 Tax=Anopheles funestus TaxID=62324 RepID=UPI0020C5E100|nr:facilitated trehalose transporter Tret1-like isoform X2 [Anopheles funestus]